MEDSRSGGIGVLGLLGVVFVTLKLTGYIDWSWWYVTMPFWLGLAFGLSLLLFAGICFGIAGIIGSMSTHRTRRRRNRW